MDKEENKHLKFGGTIQLSHLHGCHKTVGKVIGAMLSKNLLVNSTYDFFHFFHMKLVRIYFSLPLLLL